QIKAHRIAKRVPADGQLATGEFMADRQRVFSGIVENAVHEKEIAHLRLPENLFDFLDHGFRRTKPVALAFEFRVDAVAAFERAAALGLHAYKSPPPRLSRIVPQVVARRRQFTELGNGLGRGSHGRGGISWRSNDAVNAFERLAFFQSRQDFLKRALTFAHHAAVRIQPAHPALRRNGKTGAAKNQRATETLPHDAGEFAHLVKIRTRREEPAVVEIADAEGDGLKIIFGQG